MHTKAPYIMHEEETSSVDDFFTTLQTDVVGVAVDGSEAGHARTLFIAMVVRDFGRSPRTR